MTANNPNARLLKTIKHIIIGIDKISGGENMSEITMEDLFVAIKELSGEVRKRG